MWSIFGVVSVAVVLSVQSVGVRGDNSPYQSPNYEAANYAYQYAVKDQYAGVDFSADESRQADNTEGSYKVLLPDGRVQTVVYSVNGPEGGYVADVVYDGEAKIAPASYKPAPAPYKPAPAPYQPAPAPAPSKAAPAPAPAPVPAPAPAYKPAPAPAYQPAPAPAYKPKPSPYKAFPRLQQATSYKSRIVFTKPAAKAVAEEERNSKALSAGGAIINQIPDVDLAKESRILPEEVIVDVTEELTTVIPTDESRRRSTTPATNIVALEEATAPALVQEPTLVLVQEPAPVPSFDFARSTTLPPLVIDTTIAPVEDISTTVAPTTQAAVVFETTAAPVEEVEVTTAVVVETVAPVEVTTSLPEVITTEAAEAIQAEAESTAEETNNARRFARYRQNRQYSHAPASRQVSRPVTRTRHVQASYPSYPAFSHFSKRTLNVQQPAPKPLNVRPNHSFAAPTITYGNWVPVAY